MQARDNRKLRTYRRKRLLICYVILLMACCFFAYGQLTPGQNESGTTSSGVPSGQEEMGQGSAETNPDGEDGQDKIAADAELPLAAGVIHLDGLYSPFAIVIDAQTGQALAEKNSGERIYPASMTKLLAALTAAEHTEHWDAAIEIPQEIFSQLYFEHASLAGFEPGEKVTPEELLYGMLLPSGAECCTTYAIWLAGDEETFVSWMNDKAAELGMEASHFTNTTGLHHEDHYSTVADMALLLEQCLQNEILRSILSAESYQTAPTAWHPQGLILQSTLFQTIAENKMLSQRLTDQEILGVTLLGGKTGYTSQAGLCLASFARIGDREYLLVTAGAQGSHYTEPFHIEDALNVYGQLAEAMQ